ncbi:DUF202 domain-containing protein [uncultured Propionivibrio sp.]|uniref:YidH family protein n=1 Tax=uncultured Propionivibrio sp. TaxID=426737 RepID=UPI0029C0CB1C|nr:DUF202 domain-containing protein [uncultured Propionivibrio sp.]
MNLRDIGEAPDYRFTLANERTFLAWIRTALGFLAAGVGLEQVLPNLTNHAVWEALSLFLYFISVTLAAYGYWRWRCNEEAMRLNQDLAYTSAQKLIVLAILVIVVTVTWCLFSA